MKTNLIMNLSDYEFQVLKTTLENAKIEISTAIKDGITEESKEDVKEFESHLSAIKTILEFKSHLSAIQIILRQMGERK